MNTPKAGEKVNDYSLLKELGSGTSGTVWKVEKDSQYFAIKFFISGLNSHAKEEFDLMQKMEHPSIIDEYEMGSYGGKPYMVMDFLEGKPLDMADPTDFSPEEVEQLARDIANGLAHAHEYEIIHKDLKPANIFITQNKKVKILDFGASAPISYNPHQKLVAGTYSYMSPEQLAGRANFQNDIWSYGVTLYWFLTRKHPYQSKKIEELSEKMLLLEVDFPHHLNPDISPKLSYVIMKCLRKNVPDRYRNFGEVLKDLNGDPVQDIVKKFGGRRRMLKRLKFNEKSLKVAKNVQSTTETLGCLALPLSIASGINFDGLARLIHAGIVRTFRLKSRQKISIEKDLMKVALLYDEKKFTSLIERINTYRSHNRRGIATLEYLLFWHWKNDRPEEAELLATELLELNENNVPALSFFTNWHYRHEDYPRAVEYCQKLMVLNPGDSSSFFFEKVLLQQNQEENVTSPEVSTLDETLVREASVASVNPSKLSGLHKEIFQYGFVSLPINITQYNLHHLIEKASPEQSSTGRRILSRAVNIKANLVFYQDYLQIRPEDKETEKISHINNTGFSLPETIPYSGIEQIALEGSAIQFKDFGWFTFRFANAADQLKLRDYILRTVENLKGNDTSYPEVLDLADHEKKKEKSTATLYLSLLGLVTVAVLIVYSSPEFSDAQIVLGFVLLITYIALGEIWRTLIAFWIYPLKKLKLRRWFRNIRYNSEHFRAFYTVLLQHSLLPKLAPPEFPPIVEADPFSIDGAKKQLTYGSKSIPFSDISAIQVSDRKLKILTSNSGKFSFPHKNTNYEAYLPIFCQFLGDKIELV